VYFKKLNKIKFKKNTLIKVVLQSFNETAALTEKKGFGVVVDSNNKCIGVVTDGDIRNFLSKKGSLQDPISKAMQKKFIFGKNDDPYHLLIRLFDKNILHLPILDNNNTFIDLITYSQLHPEYEIDNKIFRSRCPVRISFSGGGSDFSKNILENESFIFTSTINKYCYASVKIRDDKKINISSRDLDLFYSCKSIKSIKFGDNLDLIKSAIIVMNPRFGFDLETYSELKNGTGLGSSSSLTVAVISVINEIENQKKINLYRIVDLAYKAERQINKIKLYSSSSIIFSSIFRELTITSFF